MENRIEDQQRSSERRLYRRKHKHDERVHKGLVLVSALYTLTMHMGSALALAVLFEDIRVKYGEDRASTAAVGSIFFGCQYCSGLLVGMAIHRIGPRLGTLVGGVLHSLGFVISYFATSIVFLQLAYGILGGIGNEFIFMTTSLVMPQYFQGRSAVFALTVIAAGPGIGAMCLPYLLTYLTRTYTLNGTFLIMGGILMNSVPCALLWSPLQQSPKQRTGINSQSTDAAQRHSDSGVMAVLRRLGRNRQFTLYTIGACIVLSSSVTFQTLMTDIWLSKGMTSDNTILLMLVFFLIGIIGRIAAGVMKFIPRVSVLVAAFFAAFLSTVSVFALNFATSFHENVVIAVIFGIGHSGNFGAIFVVVSRLVEWNQFSIGMGVLMGLTGILSAFLPPLHGHLRDSSGSYTASLMYLSGSLLVGSILFLSALIIRIRRTKRFEVNVVVPIEPETRVPESTPSVVLET